MTKRVITLISLSILLAILPLMANGPQWNLFLNSKKVNCLADYGDYLLIGTSHGGMTKLHKKSGEKEYINFYNSSLGHRSVEDILINPDGDIWVSTPDELYKYTDGSFVPVTDIYSTGRFEEAADFFFDSSGDLWISYKTYTSEGNEWVIGVFSEQSETIFTEHNSALKSYSKAYQFCQRPDGTVWFETGNGIYFCKDRKITQFTDSPMGFTMNGVQTIACDTKGTLWFGSSTGGIVTYNDTSWTIYDTSSGTLPDNFINSITAHGDDMWISTKGGVAKKDASGWTTFTSDNSEIPNAHCLDIVIDSSGDAWMASGEVVFHYDDEEWQVFDPSLDKTPFVDLKTKLHIEKSNAITLLASTGTKAINGSKATLEGDTWKITTPTAADSQYYAKQRSIIIDENDNPWIGTEDGEIHHYDGSRWKTLQYPRKERASSHRELPPDFGAMDLVLDKRGDLWVAADQNGLAHYNGEIWTMHDTIKSGSSFMRNLSSVAVDSNGHIWTGQSGQIQVFDGTTWTTYDKNDSEHLVGSIQSIAFDSKGVMWAGSSKKGLIRYDGTTWSSYTTQNSGISYNDVAHLTIDQFDNKWLMTYDYHYGSILVQFHESGIKSTNIIETSKASMSSTVTLQKSATKSRLSFPTTGEAVTLDLFDLKGRLVMQLRQAATVSGVRQVEVPHGDLSHGLYLYQLQTGSEVYSGKLILE